MNTPPPREEPSDLDASISPAPLEPYAQPDSVHAANTLEHSDASYRFLFETNPHPMWIYDSETLRFLLVNEAAIEHYGYSQDEFLAMTLLEVRPVEDRAHLSNLMVQALQSSVPNKGKHGVWRHQKKDGQIIEVEVTVNDLRFQGRAARMVLLHDVTESRRIERALRQSEQEQRQLAEHLERERERLAEAQAIARVGSWEMDMTTNLVVWSEETYRICDVKRTESGVTYETFLALVHPDDREAVHHAFTEALANRVPYAIDHRIALEDGSIKIVHERGQAVYDATGRALRAIGTVQDITEQKQAEEERDRFFTLSLDLLCVMAPNGHFIRMNPAFETVLGYTRDDLMASPLLEFVHPDDREATIAEFTRLNAGVPNLHFENRLRCLDGSYRWFAWTVTSFQGFLYCAAHDITPIKEAEIALHRSNDELEARVVARTAEIMEVNTQLLLAKQEAESANHAKSEFLSRMSHELRTPLNAILGFGQILDKETLSLLQKESIQYILKGGRHLLDLINEILDLARVEAGHMDLSLEPIALTEIVCESCALVRPLAAERDIFIDIEPAAFSLLRVQADRQRLKQVLINLLSNAIKYNRSGGQVRVYGLPPRNGRLCIAIQDTGPGITPEDQQKLFTPFERLNAANSEVEGTGLGLVLAQRLVTAMGGFLTFESLPGEGTTFFLELPQALSPIEVLVEHPMGSCEQQPDPSEKPLSTILSIEDNLSNMRLLEVLLRSRPGTTLLTAMQGSIGLDLARQHKPDLILLDLNLPDLSGREVLARLQSSEVTHDIPVVILSADATTFQIERLLSTGARAYLTKPLDVAKFLGTLDTILLNSTADRAPSRNLPSDTTQDSQ